MEAERLTSTAIPQKREEVRHVLEKNCDIYLFASVYRRLGHPDARIEDGLIMASVTKCGETLASKGCQRTSNNHGLVK